MAAAGSNKHTPEYTAENEATWKREILEREQGRPEANWAGAVNPRVCSKGDWEEVWPKDHKDYHDDFDERHLSVASKLPSGEIEVHIPWRTQRRAWKAGGPSHYMQFFYLKDEAGAIRAIAKFEHTDTVIPWVFPASAAVGAKELTPYSVDVIHGVWKGETLDLRTAEL
eukprot:g6198.t1